MEHGASHHLPNMVEALAGTVSLVVIHDVTAEVEGLILQCLHLYFRLRFSQCI